MSDLAAWLEQAGLEHLAASLAEHDVDLAILADLGDADLEKIGLSLGNRRKLLRAVAADPALARTVRAPAAASAAERRQLTVLFCDLVESSALAAALDPEELQVLINDYWSLCKERVSQHNGVVARHMGDGLLVYFGYPVADEHSVERAIKAGLAIVRDIGELRSRPQRTVAVRVGIATGEVVIGDLVRTGDAAEIAAYGPAPFLAARLQSVARPNSVLIDDNAHRIAGGLFEYETPQLRTLKGFGDNVQAQ